MHTVTYKIKDAWRKKKVVSVLFLDIEGAFPNMVNEKLLQNMKSRCMPAKLVQFTENLLRDRSTMLKFDDYISEGIPIRNGIGRGDPLSMILYQYYNADLLDIPDNNNESVMAYVDDTILIATGSNFTETHKTLLDMMMCKGGAIDWSDEHHSHFEFSKLALMDFTHCNSKKERPPLKLLNTSLTPVTSAKYLGVHFDQHLEWGAQHDSTLEKGTKWAAQIRRVAAPSWGLTPKHARQVYISIAIPRILYTVDVWGSQVKHGLTPNKTGKISGHINKLKTTQRAGTLTITVLT
jgi:hypothetical protein